LKKSQRFFTRDAPSKIGEPNLDLDDVKAIIDLTKQNDLAVFKLEREGFKLQLEAQRPIAPVVAAVPPTAIATQALPTNVTGSGGAAGFTTNEPVELVVFYAGQVGLPITVNEE
jgi:hypothetical protein